MAAPPNPAKCPPKCEHKIACINCGGALCRLPECQAGLLVGHYKTTAGPLCTGCYGPPTLKVRRPPILR